MNHGLAACCDEMMAGIRETLFHPGTGLIYDYVSDRDPARRFGHLPTPEEIAAGFPNPCGWGTGMEDCALNGGLMLETLQLRGEGAGAFAARIADGVIRCGRAGGTPGFVVRGISPRDGRSCYGNSSRDQFTLAVYGVWRLLAGGAAPEPRLREAGRRFLREVAGYCARTVTPENDFNLLRLDGRPAIVSKLWACMPHEMLRLPMIYGAAAAAAGDEECRRRLRCCAAEGVARTLAMDPDGEWWDMPIIQTQLSLRFFLDSAVAPELTDGVRRAMRTVARIAELRLEPLLREAEQFSGSWTEPFDNWRRLPMYAVPETLAADGETALFGGRSYLNPRFREAYCRPNAILRGIGNYLATIGRAPEARWPEGLPGRLERIFRTIDFSRCTGAGLVPLLYGCSVLEQTRGVSGGTANERGEA